MMADVVFAVQTGTFVALAALVVSACVAIPTILSIRRQKPNEILDQMNARMAECEMRIRDLKKDLDACSRQRQLLEDENARLMRDLAKAWRQLNGDR